MIQVTPNQDQIAQQQNPETDSPELTTATQATENSKLEKLVYKVSGDFRAKILREKNAKIWKKLEAYFLAEISFLLESEARKEKRAERLGELERLRKEKEGRIVECLEGDLAEEADLISGELEEIEKLKIEIEEESRKDNSRQDNFLKNCKLFI